MLVDSLFIQLTLWVAATHAFFPWIPCEPSDSKCQGQSKRHEAVGGTVTLPLSQRARDPSEPEPERASRAARHFSRKYDRSGPARTGLSRRQNNKYNVVKASTPTFADSAAIHQDGTDFSYFVDVGLGSAPKSVYMLLDTGAGTTWVMGSTCKSSPCTVHNSFGPDDSSTFQTNSKAFSIAYGSGTVSGFLATDTMAFAGKKVSLSFGIANSTSDDFNHFPFDGILGMSMSTGATDNILQVFKKEKVLQANVFGVYINRNSDGANAGEVSFGAANPAKYTGAISYSAVSSSAGGDWAIPLGDFAYDGKAAGISGRLAYIDTGTTFIFGPPSDLALIHKQIPGAQSGDGVTYTVPCDSAKPLSVSFAGVSYTIQAKDWMSGPTANGDCVSNLYGHEVVKGAWLLGDAFLKNVYAVFDMDQSRIGFALRPAIKTTTTTTMASPTGSVVSSPGSTGSTTPGTVVTPLPATSSSSSNSGPKPGLDGHETSSSTTGTSAPASSTTAPSSPAGQLEIHSRRFFSLLSFTAAMFIMA